jgi:crotonobetaine/carnitine-CoA ligase
LSEFDISPDDSMTMIYTSGTTGKPKGVVQTHRTYVLTGQSFPYWLELTSEDRLFTCLPLFHINAQAYSTLGSIGAGASLILAEKFSASGFWKQVSEHQATEFNAIGSMMLILLKQPPGDMENGHRVRLAYCAPALPEGLEREFERRFGIRVIAGYGLSECTFGSIEPLNLPRKFGSVGLPRQHPFLGMINELRIANQDGTELGPGEVGEIQLRNPAIMKEYYRDPQLTAEVLRNGWLHTGDLGYRDQDGYLYFFERKQGVIRRMGENISSAEVEGVVAEHPKVLECAVIGLPSEFLEEEVKMYVVLRPGTDLPPDELLEWCENKLASFKVPRYVEFRQSLPKTETQRIAKNILRSEKLGLRVGSYDRNLRKFI